MTIREIYIHRCIELAKLGSYAITGMDLSRTFVKMAAEKSEQAGVRVEFKEGSASNMPFPKNSFDFLLCRAAFKNFADPVGALQEMCRVLRPGGALVLNVAALPALRGNHSILGGEVQRYTRSGLRRHLEQAGFSVERLTYTNFAILPVVAAVRFSQRLRQGRHELSDSEMTVPAPPVNLALAGLLTLESYALRVVNMPLGSSLLTLAIKR